MRVLVSDPSDIFKESMDLYSWNNCKGILYSEFGDIRFNFDNGEYHVANYTRLSDKSKEYNVISNHYLNEFKRLRNDVDYLKSCRNDFIKNLIQEKQNEIKELQGKIEDIKNDIQDIEKSLI